MDIKSFFRLLGKYKWVLIIVPIFAISITYFFVKNLPQQYSSKVQISTGLLDPSKKVISNETVDYYKVSQQFSNMMEKLKSKRIIDRLSFNLLVHDLEEPQNAFRPFSKNVDSLKQADKMLLLQAVRAKLLNKTVLTAADNKGKLKLYDIVNSMGYGEDDLSKLVEVFHVENSDYIDIEFVSENPNLSAFAVNTLATEFISTYTADVNANQNSSIALLDSLLKRKEQVMNEKNTALSEFKRTKGVLNLDEQSATVYSQISVYEAQRAQALREIQSNQGAIHIIEGKLQGSDPFVRGSSRSDNQEIVRLKRQLELANSSLIDNNFTTADQKKVDSLSRIISQKSVQNSDDNVLDPRTSKQSLVQQKLALEISLQQAKSSIRSLDNQLSTLRSRYQSMVPFDADIQNYQREADLATKDYTAALEHYNNSRTQQNMGVRFQVEQAGLPGSPEPSKQGLYLAGAGISSLMFCVAAVFILFILDSSIVSVSQLELATKSRSLGIVNFIDRDVNSISTIWNNKESFQDYATFKDLIRSLRFEISNKMDANGCKILGVTSLVSGEGKTFISYSLAYAFAMTGKKILLIADDQPVRKAETKELRAVSQDFQSFLVKKEVHVEDLITIMNKTSEKNSLFELQNIKNLKSGFEILKNEFDVILIDINSLEDMNITKEWLLFTEHVIAVFESGKPIGDSSRKYIEYIRNHPGFMGWVLNKFQFAKT